jgi:hypothetical protein
MKLITHPDNLELVKRLCKPAPREASPLYGIEIVTNRLMDRTRPTGRYILPDGRAVPPVSLFVPWGRFAELDQADLSFLLMCDIVKPEHEPLFYTLDDSFLNMFDKPFMFTDRPVT